MPVTAAPAITDAGSALRSLLSTLRQIRCAGPPAAVHRWTGVEVRALRLATHHSVRSFAAYLGVSDRMVSKWERGGAMITPRPVNQAALSTALSFAAAQPGILCRFAHELHATATDPASTRNRWADLVGERRFAVHVPLAVTALEEALDVAAELAVALAGHLDIDAADITVSSTEQPTVRHAVASPWRPA